MTVIKLVISLILFVGGLALMGYAPEFPSWQAAGFLGGIIAVALAFALPMNVYAKRS
jgi:hypothetical protein